MSARYGHSGLEDLCDAVETISRPAKGELYQRSPVSPPGLAASPNVKCMKVIGGQCRTVLRPNEMSYMH